MSGPLRDGITGPLVALLALTYQKRDTHHPANAAVALPKTTGVVSVEFLGLCQARESGVCAEAARLARMARLCAR